MRVRVRAGGLTRERAPVDVSYAPVGRGAGGVERRQVLDEKAISSGRHLEEGKEGWVEGGPFLMVKSTKKKGGGVWQSLKRQQQKAGKVVDPEP